MSHSSRDNSGVFISYRRSVSWQLSRLIFDNLARRGFDVFMDMTGLTSGKFDDRLLEEINRRPNFVVIVEDGTFRATVDETDWVLFEVAHALAYRRNIVPVTGEHYNLDAEYIPAPIRQMARYSAVNLSLSYFDAAMDRLGSHLAGPHSQPTAWAGSDSAIRIFPGLSLAGVAIGSSEASVRRVLGAPTAIIRNSFIYEGDGILLSFTNGRVRSLTACSLADVMAPFDGQTPEGISIGATREAVHSAYGSPPLLKKQYRNEDVDRYLHLGLSFDYAPRQSTVKSIRIHEVKPSGFMLATGR